MKQEPFLHHIEAIFGGIRYGLVEAPAVDGLMGLKLTTPETVDPFSTNLARVSVGIKRYGILIWHEDLVSVQDEIADLENTLRDLEHHKQADELQAIRNRLFPKEKDNG